MDIMRKVWLFFIAIGVTLAVHSGGAAIDTSVMHDKTFNFRPLRTWSWSAKPGYVIVARTPEDDPEAIQRIVEPIIMDAVAAELPRRGLTSVVATPDVTLTYYLLLTTASSALTIGHFLPPVTEWGVPPFLPSTQSLEVFNRGSLILDLTAHDTIIWRGTADANVKMGLEQTKRVALIRQAVRDILKRYPPRR
jgi:hypothetical protein